MRVGYLRSAAATMILVIVAAGCVPALQRALSSERDVHDRTVDELERRVEAEAGWLVLELPNTHEGGGSTTWWLHPCAFGTDDERPVTRTAYHGSDVAGLPGVHRVERDTVPCVEPSGDLALHGRRLRLDVDAVALSQHAPSRVGLLEDRDVVEVTDTDHGTRRRAEVRAGRSTYGPCDGRSHWSARLESERELSVQVTSCRGRIAVLPDEAVALLDLPETTDAHDAVGARLPDRHVDAFVEALTDAGYEGEDIRSHTFEGTEIETIWLGPCGTSADRQEDTRTLVDVHGGHVGVSERGC